VIADCYSVGSLPPEQQSTPTVTQLATRLAQSVDPFLLRRGLRVWIRSLRPYPSLALFSVPVIMLEPVKPVAAYLAATGQLVSSVVTLVVGELLKLVLVERLFSLTRDKLMKIPAFAWAYTKFREAKAWLEATEAWQAIHAISKAVGQYLTEMKKSAAVAFGPVSRSVRKSGISRCTWASRPMNGRNRLATTFRLPRWSCLQEARSHQLGVRTRRKRSRLSRHRRHGVTC
jgi:hypothetical protein